MKLLIDTNVILDYLGANEGFSDIAEALFDLADRHNDIRLVSSESR